MIGSGRSDAPRRPFVLTAFLLLAAIGFVALGMWQVRRRAWKLDLIAQVDLRTRASPQGSPGPADWRRFDPRTAAYSHVAVRGIYRYDRETLVAAATERGQGYWVITPLRTDGGWFLLVNRGFVPAERRDARSRSAGEVPGTVRITGLLRASEPRGTMLRANDPAAGRWYSRDVAAIAHARGLPMVAPYFVDADATPNPGGLPVGGLTVVRFPNNHLVYALTWFGMALLSAAGAIQVWRTRLP